MVIYVSKFNLPPDKVDDYMQWAPTAMQSVLSAPGIKEVRVFMTVASDSQIVVTYEFDKPEDWLAWGMSEDVQKMTLEFFRYALNPKTEIWNAAPNYPEPIRP
jgi:heme-degrading monooxygenase HmoA